MWKILKTFIKTVSRPITYIAERILLFAVEHNLNRTAAVLMRCGVNVNCNNSECTPLWHAVNNSNLYLVNKLLANNADVDSQSNRDSRTVLHLAAQKNDHRGVLREDYISKVNNSIIDALIAAKPKMNLGDKNGQRPLHIAVSRCYLHATKAFIRAGANLNIRDNDQETPIMQITPKTSFAYNSARTILRVLIYAGARLDLVDKTNRTVLQKVADCRGGFDQHLACKTLLFYGAKLEELTTQTNERTSLIFINRMMHFEPSLSQDWKNDQRACMLESVRIRESISKKIQRLPKKVSTSTLSKLRLDKLLNIPEKIYPDHNIRKVKGCGRISGCGRKLVF